MSTIRESERAGTKEITRQIEAYTFQVKAIAWQILISLAVTIAVYFLGAKEYNFFFIALGFAGVFFIGVVIDYSKVRFNIVSRERGMSTSELKWFWTIVRGKSYIDAMKFLKSMNDSTAAQKAELLNTIILLQKFEGLIKKKNLSKKQVKKIAKDNGYAIPDEYYKMSLKSLEAMIKIIGEIR